MVVYARETRRYAIGGGSSGRHVDRERKEHSYPSKYTRIRMLAKRKKEIAIKEKLKETTYEERIEQTERGVKCCVKLARVSFVMGTCVFFLVLIVWGVNFLSK